MKRQEEERLKKEEYEREQKEAEEAAGEQMKKEEEERIREASKNYPVDPKPLTSSGGTITRDHTPFVLIGLTPFTPSK